MAIEKAASNHAEVVKALTELSTRCSGLRTGCFGLSVMGRRLIWAALGSGRCRVLISAGHHANEWIGTQALMLLLSELCSENACGAFWGEALERSTLYFVPLVNPDGVELAQGRLCRGWAFDRAREIALAYPHIPFPEGWKANIRGVDLNLQYPAGWEEARRIKGEAGVVSPAPRDFVGFGALTEPESRALAELTRRLRPHAVIALHSQGEVIYWKYGEHEPRGSLALGRRMSAASGYVLEETPYESGHAGYKDWFIKEFDRPGYTVELGLGENPLPPEQLEGAYKSSSAIIREAALWQ